MVTSKKELLRKIGDSYQLSPDQAKSFLSYHSKIRATLIDQYALAQTSSELEFRKTTSSEVATAASPILGFIPFIAPLIEAAANLLNLKIRSDQESAKRKKNENYLNTVQSHDPLELAELAREFADESSEMKLSQIKNLTPEQAKELAKKDANELIETLSTGKYNNIDLETDLPDVLETINPTQPHQDLGKFTHNIIEHEEDVQHAHEDSQEIIQQLLHADRDANTSSKQSAHEHQDIGSFTHKIIAEESHHHSNPIKDIITAHDAELDMRDINLEAVSPNETSHHQHIQKSREQIAQNTSVPTH